MLQKTTKVGRKIGDTLMKGDRIYGQIQRRKEGTTLRYYTQIQRYRAYRGLLPHELQCMAKISETGKTKLLISLC